MILLTFRRSAKYDYERDFLIEERQDVRDQPNQTQANNGTSYALDRHAAYIVDNPSAWLIPMGILAVGLRFRESISEYAGSTNTMIENIISSVLSKYKNRHFGIAPDSIVRFAPDLLLSGSKEK